MNPAMAWLSALRRYFPVVALGSLAWECIQLPLYTLRKTSSAAQIICAVVHCTGGGVLIAGATLIGSLLLFGVADWPRAHFVSVAAVTLVAGIGITAYSKRVNTARETWTSSNLMPLLPGTGVGLAPLAQWLVIPFLAFMVTRPSRSSLCLDLPTMGIAISASTSNYLARSHWRMP